MASKLNEKEGSKLASKETPKVAHARLTSNSPDEPDYEAEKDSQSPFLDDDLNDVTPATDEEVNGTPSRTDESDLHENFSSYSKAATQGERALRKSMFKIEQKLHSVDLSIHERSWSWVNPFIAEVVEVMSEHLGISKGKVHEAAILMFYRNCFSSEKRLLADMGLMLDSFTLQKIKNSP